MTPKERETMERARIGVAGTSGKSTPNACLAEREKCRKSCNKKANADLTK